MKSFRNVFRKQRKIVNDSTSNESGQVTNIESRPKLPTPTTSDEDDDDGDYEEADEMFSCYPVPDSNHAPNQFPGLSASSSHKTTLENRQPKVGSPKITRGNSEPTRENLKSTNRESKPIRGNSTPTNLNPTLVNLKTTDNNPNVNFSPKKPLLPPKKALHQSNFKHQLVAPMVPVKPTSPNICTHRNRQQLPIPPKKINVVKPNVKHHPKIESGLHDEIIYVHKQRGCGFNLFEISLQDKQLAKPSIPPKPGRQILIKKPPPLPGKPSSDDFSNSESNPVQLVNMLSVYELAKELSELNVERDVVNNIKRLKIDGQFITKMNRQLISSSLEANELDTLKIYRYVYHGWKPLL